MAQISVPSLHDSLVNVNPKRASYLEALARDKRLTVSSEAIECRLSAQPFSCPQNTGQVEASMLLDSTELCRDWTVSPTLLHDIVPTEVRNTCPCILAELPNWSFGHLPAYHHWSVVFFQFETNILHLMPVDTKQNTPRSFHIAPNRKAKAQATIMRCFDILH
jgi:hypothetical protein